MLSLAETWLRLHIGLFATATPLLVRLPLGVLLRLTEGPGWFRPYRRWRAEQIQAMVDRRLADPRMMRRRACLRYGLVLYHFLRLAGLDARLHFGLHPQADAADAMRAHCWVTLAGRPINPPAGLELAAVRGADIL